jgi:NADPH2:quinone reductase
MRALLCREWGGPDDLTVEEIEPPRPGPGEARIAVHAAGANFADTLYIAGKYQVRPPRPFVPGGEAAGEVIETGAGVDSVRPGDRVAAIAPWGAFAEEMVVPESAVFPLPDGVDYVSAAAIPVVYGTDMHALADRAGLAGGETLLVHGAAGGIGLAAVELGARMGADIIGTVGAADKMDVVREYGARAVINYRTESIFERVRELTGGAGADVILDPVGGDAFDQSMRCIAWGGRLLVVGFASGRIPELKANRALLKGCAVIGVNWPESVRRDPGGFGRNMAQLLGWCEAGELRPRIDRTLPLEETPAALKALLARSVSGKIVIKTR